VRPSRDGGSCTATYDGRPGSGNPAERLTREPDSCLSAADGQDDDSVLGGDGEDTFNADAGDFVSTVENGPTPCEGG